MADDEQFSLCWNNFNSNLSAGFHESLCRGDLVDVTLAAEGQFVKAHRLVLSVCSPYFRKMFTQMPANQHAFVFLKDVSHTALKDLIQFMYCGEVNVKQEALPAFISTAEALQIKGLTDSDPPPQAPAETHTQPPTTQIHTPLRTRQRSTTTRTYKLETVDDTDDDQQTTHHTVPTKPQTTQIVIQTTAPTSSISTQQQHLQQVVQQATVQQITPAATTSVATTQKRPLRNSGGPNVKRTKNTSTTSSTMVDPLETATETITSQPQQITVQTTLVSTPSSSKTEPIAADTTEYIDLPLELPSTKSEPEYVEDAGDQDNDQDGAYVEDDTYGDIRYDESYFTEGEDGGNVSTGAGNTSTATTSKAVVKQQQSSFSDSSFAAGESGDQTNNDTQGDGESVAAIYTATSRGRMQLVYGGQPFIFEKNLKLAGGLEKKFWRCNQWWNQKCRSRVFTINDVVYPLNRYHTHEEIVKRKKRVTKLNTPPQINKLSQRKSGTSSSKRQSASKSANTDNDLKYEEIVADVTMVMCDKNK